MQPILNTRILVITKKRLVSGGNYAGTFSSGLYNSAKFIVDMLNKNDIEAKLVDVLDNNCIDREVTQYQPTHVIVEALWVVPEKFDVLTKLHPNVKWIIRLHSELPFLANEGIATDWLYKYSNKSNISIAVNSDRIEQELQFLLHDKVIYLPNYYPISHALYNADRPGHIIDIGCFGAIRPLKNQYLQAICALKFAIQHDKQLRFHINGSRVEGNGAPILKNIRDLFTNNPDHELVEHAWMEHQDFTNLVSTMELGLQVSFSETFNIIAADFVNQEIPVITSPEIRWMNCLYKANATDAENILHKMNFAWKWRHFNIHNLNKRSLKHFSSESERIWVNYFGYSK